MTLASNELLKFPKLLERALHVGYNDASIEILQIDENFHSPKALNFLSDISKLTLKYKKSGNNGETVERTVNVVTKSEPSSIETALEIFRRQDLFGTEWKMYREVLPKIEKLTSIKIGPKILYGSEDSKTLIMEDITMEGFGVMDPKKGLSLKHCVLVINKLATLHGASVALHEKDPGLVKSLTGGGILSSECPESFLRLIEVTLLNISREIRKWSNDDYLECSEKLKKLTGEIRDRVPKDYGYDVDEFCVINHGDTWINNMMFKSNERGEPNDVLLLDYQVSVYASPAIDLNHFLNICPETSLKYDEEDYFLEIYLTVLTNVMKSTGCVRNPPTIQDLKRAMYKRRTYAVFAGLVLLPRMMADKEDIEDFDEVLGRLNGDTKMDIFKSQEAVVALRKAIIAMNERGYFD